MPPWQKSRQLFSLLQNLVHYFSFVYVYELGVVNISVKPAGHNVSNNMCLVLFPQGASRDALNAEEAAKVEQEAKLDAEREHETSHDFQEGFFTGPSFGLGHGSGRKRNAGSSTSSGGLFGGLSSGFGVSSDLFGTGNLGHGSFSGLGGKLPF